MKVTAIKSHGYVFFNQNKDRHESELYFASHVLLEILYIYLYICIVGY